MDDPNRRASGWCDIIIREAGPMCKAQGRRRASGTARLDKGFFSRKMARTLEELGVSFPLKVPRHPWLRGHRNAWRFSAKGEAAALRWCEVEIPGGRIRPGECR